jgi:hypothetical protein
MKNECKNKNMIELDESAVELAPITVFGSLGLFYHRI